MSDIRLVKARRPFLLHGTHVNPGEIKSVPRDVAAELIGSGKAESFTEPPAKPEAIQTREPEVAARDPKPTKRAQKVLP